MQDAAELIRAVADLLSAVLWPLVVVFVILLLKDELPAFVQRVRRVVLRQGDKSVEVELGESQAATRELTSTVDDLLRRFPPSEDEIIEATAQFDIPLAEDPRLTLISLAARIETETRRYLATFSAPENWRAGSVRRLIERAGLPKTLQRAAKEFQDVRNVVVHGGKASPAEIARAIDLGVTLLEAIQRLPKQEHVVVGVDIELFADEAGAVAFDDVRAVRLETRTADGTVDTHVFPAARAFFVGQSVTWEWDEGMRIGPAWYRDATSGDMLKAWDGALGFAGRTLDEI